MKVSLQSLKYVRVDFEFFGNKGQAVYNTKFTPVSHWGTAAGSVKFLGSGETWFTEDNEFLKSTNQLMRNGIRLRLKLKWFH